MRKFFFILIAATVACISACNKNASKLENQSIEIRIKNATEISLTDVIFKDEFFGSLEQEHVSGYKSFTDVIAYPGARIVIGKDTIYAGMGYCGTEPLPRLQNGKYTLKVFYDQQWLMYNAVFIEE